MSAESVKTNESDIPVLFFAPFVSPAIRVEHGWIDHNGHMDIAHYDVMFERALEQLFSVCGLGPHYASERGHSMFVVESRASYRQELTEGDAARVTVQVMSVDDKRVHCYLEVRHALDGWVAASAEKLALHVDLNFRRATSFPADIRRCLEELRDSHAALPRPERLGQGIVMPATRSIN